MTLLVLSLLFWASPSLDVARYECFSYTLQMTAATCPWGSCLITTAPTLAPCNVAPPVFPALDYLVYTASPAPGQVVAFCVKAVDTSGNESPCIGGP